MGVNFLIHFDTQSSLCQLTTTYIHPCGVLKGTSRRIIWRFMQEMASMKKTMVISGPSKGNIRVLSGKPMKNSQSLRPTARHILSQTLEMTVKQLYDLILTFTDSSAAWSVTPCPTYLSERCRLPCHCRTGHLRWLDISESLPAMTTIASQGSLECSCAI